MLLKNMMNWFTVSKTLFKLDTTFTDSVEYETLFVNTLKLEFDWKKKVSVPYEETTDIHIS